MKLIVVAILSLVWSKIYSKPTDVLDMLNTEEKIIVLSENLNRDIMALARYMNLRTLCNNDLYKEEFLNTIDQIHEYHDMLEMDLQTTTYHHSKTTISKILKHMDKLDTKFHPDDFSRFLNEQCSFVSKIEQNSRHYKAAFAIHSYDGKVYAQEVVMYRYLKRLTKRITRIRNHVEHFYMKRKVWEH